MKERYYNPGIKGKVFEGNECSTRKRKEKM
jgi:hypothetical protein